MAAYSILALNTVLDDIPAITGRPTFKALWDLMRMLLPSYARSSTQTTQKKVWREL